LACRKGIINEFGDGKLLFRGDQGAPLPSRFSCSIAQRRHVGASDARSRAMDRRISRNMPHDTTTSASWNVT